MSTELLLNEVVVKFQRGDVLAFKKLFESLSRQMLYVTQGIVKDTQTADEIVSDGFLKLWEARRQFNNINSVRAYLYVLIRNASLNHARAVQQRIKYTPLEEHVVVSEPEALVKIIKAEFYQAVYRELTYLTRKQEAVFRLSVIEGRGTEEICEALQISPGSVFTHRSAAIKALRKGLREHSWASILCFSIFFLRFSFLFCL
ncbi:RNA polymerase sigma factor [Parapedobacter soli]|uniref:RNA polymerase sigma factor n=1 Tax=Parapedobacter soli TaxID=416955 RepID=UPI0021C7E180|nr:sigma-70 family RNA polymerase sigma factor [Parapedobacter soli]